MVCQVCKEREATIHFTNMVGNKVEKIHLCHLCAEEKGFDYLKKSSFGMGDLLAGLLGNASGKVKTKQVRRGCPNCGTSYARFKKVGRLGCSECYDFFKDQLMPLLRGVHGDTRHLGKIPKRFGKRVTLQRRVHELKEDLRRAVELEQYERAAELRDEIKRLTNSDENRDETCRQ
ncbi:MAG: UvrB/UvrC motif-containing protein [bacterium]|nr:MAG: UvrB/UvrC motif-containing protein [bacterium]